MTALDDTYAGSPDSPESEAVWGSDVWAMDPERHTTGDRWAAPFADIDDYWEGWD